MAINVFNSKWLLLALLALGVVSGCCCQAYPLPGEDHCPTDARRLYLACGEEAVRRCPCGRDREFYGLKPTCWRTWPEGWRCGQVGDGHVSCGSACGSDCGDSMGDEPVAPRSDLSNPFRNDSSSNEEPLPPARTETMPSPVTAAPSPAPAALPAQPPLTPAPLPPLEKAQPGAVPTNPPAENPNTQYQLPITPPQPAPIIITPPQTNPLGTPPAPVTPLESMPPQPAPAVPPATPTAPMLPPQDFLPKSSATKPTAPVVQQALATTDVNPEVPAPKPTQPPLATKSQPKKQIKESPLSDRVEQHLVNNLQM